jgi:hypothetical protein
MNYQGFQRRVGELYPGLKSRFNMVSERFVIGDSPNHSPVLFSF